MVVERVMGDEFETDESLQDIDLEDIVSDKDEEDTLDHENSQKNNKFKVLSKFLKHKYDTPLQHYTKMKEEVKSVNSEEERINKLL